MPTTCRWIGGRAAAVAQIVTITPANIEADDVFGITLSNDAGDSHAITFTAGATTAKNVVEGLKAAAVAASAAGYSPWNAVTPAEDDSVLTLTAIVAGVPFTVATTAVNGGAADTQTLTAVTTLASAGPNDLKSAANWDDGLLPTAGDTMWFVNSAQSALYGLNWSAAAPAAIVVEQSYTGLLGQANGYLLCGSGAIAITIGQYIGSRPSGSGRINISAGTGAATVTIYDSAAQPTDSGQPVIRLLTTNAASVIDIRKGKLGIASSAGETSQLATLLQGWTENQNGDTDVVVGSGVTIVTITKTGGELLLRCAATTVNNVGSLTTEGSGAITTLVNRSGIAICNSTGTITKVQPLGGLVDFSRSSAARTVSEIEYPSGAGGQVKLLAPTVPTVTAFDLQDRHLLTVAAS
jgi:hypothetical protein